MALAFLKTLFSGSTFVKEIFTGIDNLTTTREEKEGMKLLIERNLTALEMHINQSLTDRHKADMISDSWLSKNIRPLVLIFILVCYVFMVLLDAAGFAIHEHYISLLGQWGMLVMSFYFGSRGIEKIFEIMQRKNEKQ
jgi:hypothetical protein